MGGGISMVTVEVAGSEVIDPGAEATTTAIRLRVGVFHRGTAMEVNFAVKDVVTNPAVKDSADLRLVPTISSITKTGISTRRRSCQLDLFSIFSFYVIFQNFRFNELIYYE